MTLSPEAWGIDLHESGVSFAETTDRTVGVEPDLELGYRLGLALAFENGWDATVRFASVAAEESFLLDDAGGGFAALLLPGSAPSRFSTPDEIRGLLDLDFQVMDFELGRAKTCESGSRFRVFFGVRLAWFDQDLDAFHVDGLDAFLVDTALDWRGVGPRVGVEGHAALGDDTGWSLFGMAAASVLRGRFDWRQGEELLASASAAPSAAGTVIHDHFDETTFVGEAEVGFAWQREGDPSSFGIRFGYGISDWSEVPGVQDVIADLQAGRDIDGSGFGTRGPFFRLWWTW